MVTHELPALCTIEDFLSHEYDFLIVGGGTAGLAVAARLSENPSINVGVLEAGPANINDPMILMPALYTKTIGDAKYDWNHYSVPQKYLTKQSPFHQSRGKGLGGSSAINYQMYVRGHASDYDDWEKLGIKGWSFKDLLPYFKKHEHFDDPSLSKVSSNIPLETKYDPSFHGSDGPIHTSFATWRLPVEREWNAASLMLGEKRGSPSDAWSGDHLGTFHSLSTIDRSGGEGEGTRSYAVTGYLLPNAARPNLRVLTEALVEKLVVSSEGVVSGVVFEHAGTSHTVSVKKEVVLSAGVFKSPQILELSGIGNSSILSAAGIETIVNNPRIGENLHDHPTTGFGYELALGENSLDALQDPAKVAAAMGEYIASKTGPLSSGGAAIGFVSYAAFASADEIARTKAMILDPKYTGHSPAVKEILAEAITSKGQANIQILILPASLDVREAHEQQKFLAPPAEMLGKQGVTVGACVARPLSVGRVHVSSSNPRQDPAIDPGYLSHPADVEILRKGLMVVEEIVATSPFKEKIERRFYPEGSLDLSDKQAAETFLRANLATQYHPLGTCGMGVEGVSAVDDRLRVHGCKGVRVVDASVIPLQVSGNIVATVYALAEKGADLIKADWGL
ncbi:hypothetical protein VTL71DRAFT_14771 [Oculimacula yallundae]|uniref:Glucose-methanol-choline oxidoreductase N-terminal domain-containing protein n=1 Tax=Oculimacula yallundae TaxID=86028 RepID=A0ABR4CJF2_9HELO